MVLQTAVFALCAALLASRSQLAGASLSVRAAVQKQDPFDGRFAILNATRKVDMLANITGQPRLPYLEEVLQDATLNLSDIQCDILVGMKKKLELFYFFTINEPKSFKFKLHNYVVPQITSTLQMLGPSSGGPAAQPMVGLNLAFSQAGLNRFGITDNLNDPAYSAGQFVDANNLGDPGTANWVKAFTATQLLHGVFLIASDDPSLVAAQVGFLEALFDTDMSKLYSLQGSIRPPPFDGHEMFGYLDGIGQPAVSGFNVNPVLPGQLVVNAGVILVGEPGDAVARPAWAKDGSFLAFRQLQQLVPEFNIFLDQNAPVVSGLTHQQSADLLGARMIGRWKSGAPVQLAPLVDNPPLGIDQFQNNNFDFTNPPLNFATDQSRCPFDAHIRKTRPRADLVAPANSIMRAGIPYGPELTPAETKANKSDPKLERGLAFVAYQSHIGQGFQFMQQAWANNPNFVFGKSVAPGHDPIIGANHGGPRFMSGYNVADTSQVLKLPFDFVISRGGEYFFSPSISALKNFISV